MAEDRLPVVREMILARTEEDRRAALDRLLAAAGRLRGHLRGDAGLPVTIRLLDPPLHEFLPAPEEATTSEMRARIAQPARRTRCSGPAAAGWAAVPGDLRDAGACDRAGRPRSGGTDRAAPLVEIMHPLVGFGEELRRLRELTERVAAEEPSVAYFCGTMIELPRACIRATRSPGSRTSSPSARTT